MNDQIEIRDTRNGEWSWVYNAVFADTHIFPADKAVYGALSTFGGFQVIRPSIEEIAKRAGMSKRQAYISINTLEQREYIKIEHGGGRHKANVYYLLKRPKGCNNCTVLRNGAITAQNGAITAPQLDIDKDIESRSSETPDDSSFPKGETEEKKKVKVGAIAISYQKKATAGYGSNVVVDGGDLRKLKEFCAEHSEEMAIKVLEWYLKTDKFLEHPNLKSALTSHSLTKYYQDIKTPPAMSGWSNK